jgi:hypothetical protein
MKQDNDFVGGGGGGGRLLEKERRKRMASYIYGRWKMGDAKPISWPLRRI